MVALVITEQSNCQRPGSGALTDYNNAQQFMSDGFGRPLFMKVEHKSEGSYFFPEDYSVANVTVAGGKVYTAIKVKINLLENKMLYKDGDAEFVAVVPISKVEFIGTDAIFTSVQKDDKEWFCQVLDSGRVSLLKKYTVTYKDDTPYGTTSITRTYSQKPTYYILRTPDLSELNRSEDKVVEMLSDKRKQVSSYIQKNNIRIKREEDLIRVFQYYNSL